MNKLNLENLKSFLEQKSENFDLDQDTNDFDEFISHFESDYDSLFNCNLYIDWISVDAVVPSYAYPSDSGFDLYSTEEITIAPMGRGLIPTGLAFDIKDGFEIQVRSKSGLALNQGLMVLNSPGTVDSGYQGEIKVIMFNTTNQKISKANL
jgi:deoxyuridine 5'-triphosphate nucleotidohydrolase